VVDGRVDGAEDGGRSEVFKYFINMLLASSCAVLVNESLSSPAAVVIATRQDLSPQHKSSFGYQQNIQHW